MDPCRSSALFCLPDFHKAKLTHISVISTCVSPRKLKKPKIHFSATPIPAPGHRNRGTGLFFHQRWCNERKFWTCEFPSTYLFRLKFHAALTPLCNGDKHALSFTHNTINLLHYITVLSHTENRHIQHRVWTVS